jgi:hypothetical protein
LRNDLRKRLSSMSGEDSACQGGARALFYYRPDVRVAILACSERRTKAFHYRATFFIYGTGPRTPRNILGPVVFGERNH